MEKITKEEALSFFDIFPNGNPKHVHGRLEFVITYKLTYKDDKPVTLDLLVSKYKAYLKFCKQEQRESKYIKSPLSWLDAEGWNEELVSKESYIDKINKIL